MYLSPALVRLVLAPPVPAMLERTFRRTLERIPRTLVVTGCGRSGTQYTARLFLALGIPFSHEVMRPASAGIASWLLAARSEGQPYGTPYTALAHRRLFFVHQVREPLAVISSVSTLLGVSWEYASRFIECDRRRPLRRAMQYWLGWNALAEPLASHRFQVERIDDEIFALLDIMRIRVPADRVRAALKEVSRSANAREHAGVTWKDLDAEDAALAREIRALALRYGYAVPDGAL